MINRISGHGPNDGDVISHTTDVGKKLTYVLAGFTKFFKIMLRPQTLQSITSTLQLRDRLPLSNTFRHRLTIHLPQLGLEIQCL